MLAASWAQIDTYDDQTLNKWVSQWVPIVQQAQKTIAQLTTNYAVIAHHVITGKPTKPISLPSDFADTKNLRGVDASTVYDRVPNEVWYQLSQGKDPEDALHIAGERAKVMVDTDMQLARTHAIRAAVQAIPDATGYLRVPDAGACGLCTVVSTRLYHTSELMPIHNRCRCGVMPVFGGRQGIGGSYSKPADVSKAAEDYGDQVEIRQHGELGPVLTVKGQHFIGPKEAEDNQS